MANILSSAATAATSSDVTLADGASANLVLMVASGPIPPGAEAIVYVDTPGSDTEVARLSNVVRGVNVVGPATQRV